MDDRLALEEVFKWLKEGGKKRAADMVGPHPEFGWSIVLTDRKSVIGLDKSFAALVNRLLEEINK